MGLLNTAHGQGGRGGEKGPFPKICHTYPTKIDLATVIPYPKKIQKYINHVTYPSVLLTSAFYHHKSANFAMSRNAEVDCVLIYNF